MDQHIKPWIKLSDSNKIVITHRWTISRHYQQFMIYLYHITNLFGHFHKMSTKY